MHLGSSVTTHVYFQQRTKTSRQAAKLAGWDFRFSYAERLFCVFWKSFENFPFFTLSLWSISELLVDIRTSENVLLPFLFTLSGGEWEHLWGVREVLFSPFPYRLLITEGRIEAGGVCRGLSAERKRVNHVCNRTGFPLKWETEVGSVQIYGAPSPMIVAYFTMAVEQQTERERVLEEQ